jgi:hypothetical protein
MIKIFTIPFSKSSETFFEDDLNQFLLNKKVNSIKAEFFKNREDLNGQEWIPSNNGQARRPAPTSHKIDDYCRGDSPWSPGNWIFEISSNFQ